MPVETNVKQEGGVPETEVAVEGGTEDLFIYPYANRKKNCATWAFMSLSHKGGREYKEGTDSEGNDIFQKHKKEKDADANKRRQRSSVLNYCRFFVGRFAGYVTRKGVSRAKSEDKSWLTFNADATGRGESWDSLIKRWQEKALIKSPYWLRLDTPNKPWVETLAEEQAEGVRPIASLVDPENVIDYDEHEVTGQLIRLCVRDEKRVKASATEPEKTEVYYTEWTPKRWTRWTQVGEYDIDTGKIPVKFKERGANSWGMIPYIPLHFGEETGVFSESMIHDVADWQRDIFRIFSLLLEEWFNRTFSTTIIAGGRPEDIASQIGSMLIVLGNPNAKVFPTGADATQADSLLKGLHFLIMNLFRAAQFEASGDPKETRNAESGSKKTRDLEGLYQVLASFASATETAENRALQLWMKMARRDQLDLAKSNHPKDFHVQGIDVDIELIGEMQLNKFPRAFIAEQMRQVITRARPNLPDDVRKAVEDELAAFVETEPAEPVTDVEEERQVA